MIIIGHRGARGLAPENTLASLQKAIEHGVDMVEFDVRVSKDGVAVLHHNSKLTDPNGAELSISKTDYATLLKHKKDLVSFAEVFETLPKDKTLYIEVKAEQPIQAITDAISDAVKSGWPAGNLYIASFDFKFLMQIHQLMPEMPIIVNEYWSGVRASRRARKLDTKYVALNQRWLWRGFIVPMHRSGWNLMAYTVNNPSKAKRWQKYGLYGIVTDYPDRFSKR